MTELLEYSGYCTKEELKNTHDALKELEEKSEFEMCIRDSCRVVLSDNIWLAGREICLNLLL